MTTREYCAAKHFLPFGQRTKTKGAPCWRKIGKGYICVTDGAEKPYVASPHVFAVDINSDGNPEINAYWPDTSTSGLRLARPYAWESLRRHAHKGRLATVKSNITFDDMITMVLSVYPDAWTPTPEEFYKEYGLTYDTATGEIQNPENLT